ncbi:MAG: hypothetical protein AAFY17_07330 [Cyanobacteria bacterium J06642_11]
MGYIKLENSTSAGNTIEIDIDADEFNSGLDSVLQLFDEFGTVVAVSDDALAPDEAFSLDSYINYSAGA